MLYNTGMERNRKKSAGLNVEPPKKEAKPDTAISKIEADFFDVSRYQRKRENLLLGEFSADGKYSIKDEKILQNLVSMPKIFQEKVDNTIYAYAKYDGINLNFKIDMDISESYCSAEIYLVEVEHDVEGDNKYLTPLSNMVEIYSPKFRDHIFKAWNINLEETPLEKDEAKDYVFEYLRTIRGQYDFNKELIEILSQLYVVRLLKLLDNCGELGMKIQADYKMLLEKLLKKDPSLAQDYSRLKQILDKMIEKNKGFDTIIQNGGADILKNFSQPIDRVRGKIPPNAVEPIMVNKKPAVEKKETAAPKKKKSKSKGGDSPKPFVYSIKNYSPQIFSIPDPIVASILNPPTQTQEQTVQNGQARQSSTLEQQEGNVENDDKKEIRDRKSLEEALKGDDGFSVLENEIDLADGFNVNELGDDDGFKAENDLDHKEEDNFKLEEQKLGNGNFRDGIDKF